jgi:hypothetical protein
MAFSKEDKYLIKALREANRHSSRKFLKEFPNRNWIPRELDALIKKIDNTGSLRRTAGSGSRLRTSRTKSFKKLHIFGLLCLRT